MASFATDDIDWGVYVILDPEKLHPSNDLTATAAAAARGGAGALQLREKRATGVQLVDRARNLQAVADAYGVPFFVNDRFDVAQVAGADGVHLGPEDIPVSDANRVAPDLLVGGSAGERPRAQELVEQGVDYIGCGAIYDASDSKPDASEPRGPEAVGDVARAVSVPVLGIGGIDAQNARPVVEAGAAGIAVIRSVVSRPDPERATRRLVEAVRG
jgi:thiamine-phosphate pyrophosphorylase